MRRYEYTLINQNPEYDRYIVKIYNDDVLYKEIILNNNIKKYPNDEALNVYLKKISEKL